MFAFARRPLPAKAVGAVIAPILVSVGALLQGGCAADNAYSASVAVAAEEVESDGLPSQAPPSLRIHQLPDDPSEPYSRNYGGPNPASAPPASATPSRVSDVKPYVPADLPPDFQRKLAAATDTY